MLTTYALLAFVTFMAVAGIVYLCTCTFLETRRLRRQARGFRLGRA